jgi:dTDP-4-dehydrorhamnose 3,5-epimerase
VEVLDVVVDLRPESELTEHVSVVLSAENQRQFFCTAFAHGFVVLSETATFFYKCDNFTIKNRSIKNITILLCKLIGNFRMRIY